LPITEITESDAPVLITPDNTTNDSENPEESDEEEGGGLMDEVQKFIDADPDTGDGDDDSEAWEGETLPPHPEYIFCPPPHRKPILHLFTKHFCQHPLFPERHSDSLDAEAICRQAVSEMYQF
jgi:hypothetical protein